MCLATQHSNVSMPCKVMSAPSRPSANGCSYKTVTHNRLKSLNFFNNMATKLCKFTLLILASWLFLFAQCNKEPSPCSGGGGYAFLATAEWSPQQESYAVGDTLFLTSTISKTITDQINTSIIVDYSNSAGIGGDLSIKFLDSITRQPLPGKDSFQFLSFVGNFQERTFNQNQGINFNYYESLSNYQFKGALICKKKGIYGIGIQNLLSRGLRGKNCTNATFNMSLVNTLKNLSIWENALNITIDSDGRQKGYAFRVL